MISFEIFPNWKIQPETGDTPPPCFRFVFQFVAFVHTIAKASQPCTRLRESLELCFSSLFLVPAFKLLTTCVGDITSTFKEIFQSTKDPCSSPCLTLCPPWRGEVHQHRVVFSRFMSLCFQTACSVWQNAAFGKALRFAEYCITPGWTQGLSHQKGRPSGSIFLSSSDFETRNKSPLMPVIFHSRLSDTNGDLLAPKKTTAPDVLAANNKKNWPRFCDDYRGWDLHWGPRTSLESSLESFAVVFAKFSFVSCFIF